MTKRIELCETIIPGRRLGRHIEHDPASKAFRTCHSAIFSAKWQRHTEPFDQGELGSCTANAISGCLMTGPLFVPGRVLDESTAISMYELATRLDQIPGYYPPNDTGSSGLAAAKAAVKMGLITGYHHAFSLQETLAALSHGPVAIGINWYFGFDTPKGDKAELVVSGTNRGGHEVMLCEIDTDNAMVRGCNSWGSSWGDGGYFTMSFVTLAKLLSEGGDTTIPLK